MRQETVRILWNKRVGPVYYKVGLACKKGYSAAKPGQFVMLHFPEHMVPFLRRPFSIHRLVPADGDIAGIELLYKVVGEGTKKLSGFRKGDVVNVLGPLGNGFFVSGNFHRTFIIAGGVGVAPMLFLALSLRESEPEFSDCTVFLGAKSKQDLICRDDFLDLGLTVYTTTEDGSAGDRCMVTDPVAAAVRKRRPDMIYACGPLEMLRCVAGVSESFNVPYQVSIETMMACGTGACLGCVVEAREKKKKYLHACLDGPVFDGEKLRLT